MPPKHQIAHVCSSMISDSVKKTTWKQRGHYSGTERGKVGGDKEADKLMGNELKESTRFTCKRTSWWDTL